MRASLLSKVEILRCVERAERAADLWARQDALSKLVWECDLLGQAICARERFIAQAREAALGVVASRSALQTQAQLALLDAMAAYCDVLQRQLDALQSKKTSAEAEVQSAYRVLSALVGRMEALRVALTRVREEDSRRRLQRVLEQHSALAALASRCEPAIEAKY